MVHPARRDHRWWGYSKSIEIFEMSAHLNELWTTFQGCPVIMILIVIRDFEVEINRPVNEFDYD
jgi:hypothetical protein